MLCPCCLRCKIECKVWQGSADPKCVSQHAVRVMAYGEVRSLESCKSNAASRLVQFIFRESAVFFWGKHGRVRLNKKRITLAASREMKECRPVDEKTAETIPLLQRTSKDAAQFVRKPSADGLILSYCVRQEEEIIFIKRIRETRHHFLRFSTERYFNSRPAKNGKVYSNGLLLCFPTSHFLFLSLCLSLSNQHDIRRLIALIFCIRQFQ